VALRAGGRNGVRGRVSLRALTLTTVQPLHVALSSGIFVRHDAISNSIAHKLQVLSELEADGWPVRATVFTHGTDSHDPRVRKVDTVQDALRLPEFSEADVHFFEFGIAYPLFNAVFVLDRRLPQVAVYHNITPPHLVLDRLGRTAVEAALVQKHNLDRFDHVSCVSEMNFQDLLRFGIPAERMSVLPLPAALEVGGPRLEAPTARGRGPVQLLYVGRFVHAKGVLDLLEAVRRLRASGVGQFQVTLAGNVQQSSREVVRQLYHAERTAPTSGVVRVVATPSVPQLTRLYERADAVVLPSYHEGYCVPVVEALSMGVQVIASDAGNIPNVLGGLGPMVPAGHVDALADAIGSWIGRVFAYRSSQRDLLHPTASGDMADGEWRARVRRHVDGFSFAAYRRGFLDLLQRALSIRPEGAPAWLADAAGALV